jgi:hypothetical protein
MTILLRLLLIAVLVWALLRLVRNLLFGPPSSSPVGSTGTQQGSAGNEAGKGRQQVGSESLVSCHVCGLRVPESESRTVLLQDGERHVCSEECRQRLQS